MHSYKAIVLTKKRTFIYCKKGFFLREFYTKNKN